MVEGVHDVWKLSLLERHIDNRPDDLYNLSDVHTSLLAMIDSDSACKHPLRLLSFARASVPPTISISSAVIADCLTLLYLSVRLWTISSQLLVALSIAAIRAPFSPAEVSSSARIDQDVDVHGQQLLRRTSSEGS